MNRKQKAEALRHYRCPHCGGEPMLCQDEVSVTYWRYSLRKNDWTFAGCDSAEECGADPQYVGELVDTPICHVYCGHCETTIAWKDGTPLHANELDDWLISLAEHWFAQKAERERVALELKAARQGINPVGTVADFETRLKALETISVVGSVLVDETFIDELNKL